MAGQPPAVIVTLLSRAEDLPAADIITSQKNSEASMNRRLYSILKDQIQILRITTMKSLTRALEVSLEDSRWLVWPSPPLDGMQH